MPPPLGLIRGILGVLCIFFTHIFGRSIAERLRSQNRTPGLARPFLRAFVTALAVTWQGGFDRLTIVVFLLALASGGLGFYLERRPKKVETVSLGILSDKAQPETEIPEEKPKPASPRP